MVKRYYKRIFALFFVIALLFSLTVPAFADTQALIGTTGLLNTSRRIKAGILSGITALGIGLQPVGLTIDQAIENAVDPLNIVTTNVEETIQDYFNRSTLVIQDGVAVIDGVEYSDVWLSHDAANKFRVNALDFATAYDIASESSGIYASGVGFVYDLPVFYNSSLQVNRTPWFVINNIPSYPSYSTYPIGSAFLFAWDRSGPRAHASSVNSVNTSVSTPTYSNPFYVCVDIDGNFRYSSSPSGIGGGITTDSPIPGFRSSFSFDYVSSVIDAEPLPETDGIIYRVPTSVVNNYYNNYYGDSEHQPDFSPSADFTFDIDSPDGLLAAAFLADIIAHAIETLLNNDDSNVTIQYAPKPSDVDPEPDPEPDPGPATIADTPWESLRRILQDIQDKLQDILDSILALPGTITQGVRDIIASIATIPSTITQAARDIIQAIQSIPESILQDIEKGPIKIFDTAIDALKNFILPILTWIKEHFGIWHYVVEWVSSIAGVFSWLFGIVSSASYYIVLPIYAAIAGFIVIKIYKVFGR